MQKSSTPSARAAAAAALIAFGLAGCVTHHVTPTPSRAVAEALAHRNATQAAVCPALSSPQFVGFPFGESTLVELTTPVLLGIGQQLACHPQVSALIVSQADGHGTDAEQRQLAQARAEAVAQDLRRRGVPAARVQIQVQGTAPAGDERHLIVLAEGRRW
jgi:outer membrane protein OmpA-like peptidoglycan-associated protein